MIDCGNFSVKKSQLLYGNYKIFIKVRGESQDFIVGLGKLHYNKKMVIGAYMR